jgi:protein O-mannosyl-transferase
LRLVKTTPPLGLGLLWFAVALTPVLHFVPIRVAAADRFVYLSLVGGALAIGAVMARAQAAVTRPEAHRALWAAGGAALLALLVLTERRIPVWHDNVTLWRDTLEHNRRAYMGHFALADALYASGQTQLARRALEQAVADCPRESRFGRVRFCAYYSSTLGFLCLHQGDLAAARAAFDEALGFEPTHAMSIVGRGRVALASGDLTAARVHEETALALNPLVPEVRALLDAFIVDLERAEASAPPPVVR